MDNNRSRMLTQDRLRRNLAEFFRYFVVGGVAAVADIGTLYLLHERLNVHYVPANVISFTVGLTVNYMLCVAWVFRHRTVDNRAAEFLIFGGVGIVGMGVNTAVLWACTEFMAIPVMASKLVATFVVFLWNFGGRKVILFRKSHTEAVQA